MVGAAPELVIFDCDGVLVDSEPISVAVLIDAIAAAGVQMDEETAYERFLGTSLSSTCTVLETDYGLKFARNQLERMRAALYNRFRSELRPMPGIAEALAAIGQAVCVASSSQLERIRLSLEITGLSGYFDANIFSATMVARGKPAPDLFLLASRKMNVSPERCLVIEDSPAGIEAAKSAGMRVFAFVGGGHAKRPEHLRRVSHVQPDLIFDKMAALPALLAARDSDAREMPWNS